MKHFKYIRHNILNISTWEAHADYTTKPSKDINKILPL